MNPYVAVKKMFKWTQQDMCELMNISRPQVNQLCKGVGITNEKLVFLFVTSLTECRRRQELVNDFIRTNDPTLEKEIYSWIKFKDVPDFELDMRMLKHKKFQNLKLSVLYMCTRGIEDMLLNFDNIFGTRDVVTYYKQMKERPL